MPPTEKPVVAVFDFDGTLTYGDSFTPFLRHVAGRRAFWLGLLRLSPVLFAYGCGLVSNTRAKERMLTLFLGGRTREELAVAATDFCSTRLAPLLNPAAMERLAWHRQQGHRLVLLSASVDVYLDEWARRNGITEVLVTRLETASDRLTGLLAGANCHGPEKLNRLTAHLGDLSKYSLDSYGDSTSDRFVLDAAERPHFRAFGSGPAYRWRAFNRLFAALW